MSDDVPSKFLYTPQAGDSVLPHSGQDGRERSEAYTSATDAIMTSTLGTCSECAVVGFEHDLDVTVCARTTQVEVAAPRAR